MLARPLTVMRRFTRLPFSLPHNGGAHSAPARERRGAKGPRERPSRGVGRSPTLEVPFHSDTERPELAFVEGGEWRVHLTHRVIQRFEGNRPATAVKVFQPAPEIHTRPRIGSVASAILSRAITIDDHTARHERVPHPAFPVVHDVSVHEDGVHDAGEMTTDDLGPRTS